MILRIKVKGTFEAIVKRSETNRLSFRYLFIEFRSADEAAFALTAMDGFPFDARHTFKVNHFTDIERYAQLDETYVEPKAEDYQPRVCLSLFHGSQISKYLIRNISERGWAILRVAISTRPSAETKLRSIGMENHLSPNLHINTRTRIGQISMCRGRQ